MKRRLLLAAAGAGLAAPALAQGAWPSRPIRMIVPFPPGGGTDFVSRIAAQRLSDALGQPVVVENRPGAGGTIGANAVAQAAPDGYTIGMATSSTHPAALVLQRSVPYDPVAGFTAITQVGVTPYVLVGGPAMPGRDLRDFVAAVRAQPGRLSYASVGTSTLGYLLTRQFEALTGTRMTHVPYRGSAQVYPDLLNGTVAFILDNPSGSAGLIRDGRVRALAITRRSAALPEVPSFAEAGVPGFEGVFWYGLVAPAGLPAEIAARMQRDLARQFEMPAHRQELVARDVEPILSTPAAFAATIAADVTWMRAAAERLGLQPE
ncbi:MAG: tripartite tricarboxylate transporter substrate binding protein [Acetobacteraceae bacterium]|nr:tripartite tricarboxylate transporter substrate binding protein [Acetobacteraceae bacterium]